MAITPLMPVYPRSPVRPVRGEGVYLYGENGEKYLDFASGIAQPVDLKVGADGSLYYLSIGSGLLSRIHFNAPTTPAPVIATEANSDVAIALDSPTLVRDPFPLTNPSNFSSDGRTRVMFFVTNLDLAPNENSSDVVAQAHDGANNVFPLTVEFVGKVPGFDWLTQVVVRLPDNLPSGQAVFLSVTFHGQTSNQARIQLR